nr:MAG TPA: hypothetical protein [Caudoviricetes sp.]
MMKHCTTKQGTPARVRRGVLFPAWRNLYTARSFLYAKRRFRAGL